MKKKCTKCYELKDIEDFYGGVKSWCKNCFSIYSHERWKVRKLKAVQIMGGKCSKCGYKNNLAALDFHHINPNDKKFVWKQVCKRSWDIIINELNKCILLCKNCHAEEHHPDFNFENLEYIETDAVASLEDRIIGVISTGECNLKICHNLVYGTKYCSIDCANIGRRKVQRPSKKDLQKQLESDSLVCIGKRYGVSDNAVRKWKRYYEL